MKEQTLLSLSDNYLYFYDLQQSKKAPFFSKRDNGNFERHHRCCLCNPGNPYIAKQVINDKDKYKKRSKYYKIKHQRQSKLINKLDS